MAGSAVEALERAASQLSDAVDGAMAAMTSLDGVSPRLSGEAHDAACRVADVHQSVRRAAAALEGAGA